MSSTKMIRHFFPDWLTDPDSVQWLVSVPENTKAKCKLCKKTFSLSNIGCQPLTILVSRRKHIKAVNAIAVFAEAREKVKSFNPKSFKEFISCSNF